MRPITARDLMNPEVLTVSEDMTVEALADFLVENEIGGAPVEDPKGRLVGVVSAIDIAAVSGDEDEAEGDAEFFARGWEDDYYADEIPEELPEDDEDLRVRDIMTPTIYSVDEDASVSEVASKMLNNHIHRLLVTRDDHAVGIITSSDLLGLLVEEDWKTE